jgi:drug/metabolite transporter (DMT)-like permease
MSKLIVILFVGLVLEAVGVVLLSQGLHEIGEVKRMSFSEIGRIIVRGATNRHILLGIAFEAAFFGILIYLLSQRDVSLIWPLTSLGFVITALAAKFLRHEHISGLRWSGVALIVAGAMLVAWSEKRKPQPPASDASASNATAAAGPEPVQ